MTSPETVYVTNVNSLCSSGPEYELFSDSYRILARLFTQARILILVEVGSTVGLGEGVSVGDDVGGTGVGVCKNGKILVGQHRQARVRDAAAIKIPKMAFFGIKSPRAETKAGR
jgi:hypothetical protein